MGILSISIAIATQYLGVLLVTALLIIPAATARYFSKTPLEMLLKTFLTGLIGLVMGFGVSLYFDTATAPSLVASHVFLFILAVSYHQLKKVIIS
jgi:zinc transport system permease protein